MPLLDSVVGLLPRQVESCAKWAFGPKIYRAHKSVADCRRTFEALGLDESDVANLYAVFERIDKDGSGSLELWEVLDHLDLHRTRFAKRVFSIFDEDGSNEIDFREFVVALWQYCTLGRTQLVMFAFDLYDRDSSGAIDQKELAGMLKELYGKRYEKNGTATNLLAHINRIAAEDCQEQVGMEAFTEFVRTHPAMLAPAFIMQQTLRSRVCGGMWWDRRARERVRVNGRSIKIHDLMKAHVHEPGFHAFMDAVNANDGDALAADAAKSELFAVDWKETIAETGTVAQRRHRRGSVGDHGADRVVDKYSSPEARRRSTSAIKPIRSVPGRVTVARVAPTDANPLLKRQRAQSSVTLASTGPTPPTSRSRVQSLRGFNASTDATRTTLRTGPHGNPAKPTR